MKDKIIAFGLVVVLLLSVSTGMASALSNSGGGDWAYYKEITVKENSGELLTGYQVLVELNTENFPAKAKSDGSDLRFEDESGKELNYWIEEWNAGAKEAKIWVKVPSIPASGVTKIKIYYGNPSATAVSDGDKVFEFFDDFEGMSLDTSKWAEDAVNNIDHTVNNYFRFEDTTPNTWTANSWVTRGSKTGCQHQANWTPINSFIIDYIISVSSSQANQIGQGGVGIVDSDNTVFYFVMLVDGGEDNYHWGWRVVDESGVAYDEANGANLAKWKLTIIRNGDNYEAKFDDSSKNTYTSSTTPSKIALVGARDPATYPYLDYIQIDNIRIRKYTTTEPTITFSPYPTTTPTPTTPTPTTPIIVTAGEEKGISGFDAINSLRIEVQEDGDADFSAQYSLPWWEQFYLWIKGALGDRDATKNLIESKIESNLEREVESLEISEDGDASFVLKDYVGKVERNEGTWYWTKIYLSEGACERINLGTVSVTFPDGFFYEFDGKLPNIKHLENDDFAELYLEARYRSEVYNRMAPLYLHSTYQKEMVDIFTKSMMWEGFEIGIHVISTYIPAGKFVVVKGIMDITASSKLKEKEDNFAKQLAESNIKFIQMSLLNNAKLYPHFQNMSKLAEEECNSIKSIVSNPDGYKQNLKSLEENLEEQKDELKALQDRANYSIKYLGISAGDYGKSLFEYARDLAGVDLKHVNQALITLKEEE